jgi:hypothetical protein
VSERLSSLVAPDTTGLNFFRADRSLADLLATCASGWPPSKRVSPPDRFPPQAVDRGALAPAAANPVFEYFKSRYSPESTGGCLASPWLGRHSISAS